MVSEVRKVTDLLTTRESSEQNEAEVITIAHPILESETRTLTDALATKELERAGFQAAFKHSEIKRAQLAKTLAAQNRKTDDIRKASAAVKGELAILQNSISWRITAPLRRIGKAAPWLTQLLRSVGKLVWWAVTLQLPHQIKDLRRIHLECKLINDSKLFDAPWYLATYPKVAAAGIDPLVHYVRQGAAQGYNPNPFFDAKAYIAEYPDVAASKANPLIHYLRGGSEGRRIALAKGGNNIKTRLDAENFHWYLTPDTIFDRNNITVVYLAGEPNKPGETYRVLNYVEALRSVNVEAYWVRPGNIKKIEHILKDVDVLIIYRHGFTNELAEIVGWRKDHSKLSIYDVDDLMVLPEVASPVYIDAIRFNKLDPAMVRKTYESHQRMLLLCDAGFASTSPLSDVMKKLGKRSFVIPNGFGSAQLKHSLISRSEPRKDVEYLRIGYSSGSRTHQKDFRLISSPVTAVMRKYNQVLMTTYSATLDLEEFPEFDNLIGRVELRSLTALDQLPYEIARFDINVVPLEVGNVFCECKSQLKYYEAALVGVPTIASPTTPFREAITHGINGLLAETEEEWLKCLEDLICQPEYRVFLALNAMRRVHCDFGPITQARAVAQALRELGHKELLSDDKKPKSFDPLQTVPYTVIATSRARPPGVISVIIPLFNYARCIEECLASVKSQTNAAELDVVVIDDCSLDTSLEVSLNWLKSHGSTFRGWTLLKHERNSGLAGARNTGVEYCDSSYYFPLDADNKVESTCIARCLEKMRSLDGHTSLGAVYPSRYLFGDETYLFKQTHRFLEVGEWDPERLAKGNYIDAMALIRKSAWRRVGGYSDITARGGWQDYDFWCKFVEFGLHAKYESSAIAFYRTHENSMLHKRTHQSDVFPELIARMQEKHPWLRINSRS